MAWKRLRRIAYVALCGGMLFHATGCEATLVSLASNLISSYLTEAIMSGLMT